MKEVNPLILNTPCIFCGEKFPAFLYKDEYKGKQTLISHIKANHQDTLDDKYNAAYYEGVSYDAAKGNWL